jgi:hypothetical protein
MYLIDVVAGLTLLATAVSEAPVLTAGNAKVSPLSPEPAAPSDALRVLTHPPQKSQLSKREAKPGLLDVFERGDASVGITVFSVSLCEYTEASNSFIVRSALPAT